MMPIIILQLFPLLPTTKLCRTEAVLYTADGPIHMGLCLLE